VGARNPRQATGIKNFGWVEVGVLARGEQPNLDVETFQRLGELGITAVLSLRPDHEGPSPNASKVWPVYYLAEERELAERAGLKFRNAPIPDFSAPPPDQFVVALLALDELLGEQKGVYVHCRAGAGRTGLVTGAWSIANGQSGNEVAATYARFMLETAASMGRSPEELPAMFTRVGQRYVLWALQEIAAALGSPVTQHPPMLLKAEKPPEADHWEQRYRQVLSRWRPGP
jgi:protein tyrosine phosphatase (PTP) superfamily phosphohydrolase (DUF442 family)